MAKDSILRIPSNRPAKVSNKELNSIKESFQHLVENYSPVNLINFMKVVKKSPVETIFENSQYVLTEPMQGPQLLQYILENVYVSSEILEKEKETLSSYIGTKVTEGYTNQSHLNALESYQRALTRELQKRDTAEYLMESTIYQLHLNQMVPTLESTFKDDIDQLIFQMDSEPAAIIIYADTISKVEADPKLIYKVNPGILLGQNTTIMTTYKYPMGDKEAGIISRLPGKLVDHIIEKHLVDKLGQSFYYIMGIDKQRVADAMVGITDNKRIGVLKDYADKLDQARFQLGKYLNATVKEGIAEMQPIVPTTTVSSNDEILEEEEDLDHGIFDLELDEVPVMEMPNRIALEFAEHFIRFSMDPSEEVNLESFNNMIRTGFIYDMVLEGPSGINGIRRNIAVQGEKISRGIAHAIRSSQDSSRRVQVVAKRIPQHIDNLIDNTLGQMKKMDRDERRKRIIEGGFKVKLFKLIRNAATIGGLALIHPALAAITLLSSVAIDKTLDARVRRQILNEMEDELKMVNEKIEDSRGEGDRQKKYQLMRIRTKLERDIQRIQYRLSTY